MMNVKVRLQTYIINILVTLPDKVILFLSDGKPQDTGKIAEAITNRNEEMNNEVVMLTYGIGGGKCHCFVYDKNEMNRALGHLCAHIG